MLAGQAVPPPLQPRAKGLASRLGAREFVLPRGASTRRRGWWRSTRRPWAPGQGQRSSAQLSRDFSSTKPSETQAPRRPVAPSHPGVQLGAAPGHQRLPAPTDQRASQAAPPSSGVQGQGVDAATTGSSPQVMPGAARSYSKRPPRLLVSHALHGARSATTCPRPKVLQQDGASTAPARLRIRPSIGPAPPCLAWAALHWRIFHEDKISCPRSGKPMRVRTVVMAPATMRVVKGLEQAVARAPPGQEGERARATGRGCLRSSTTDHHCAQREPPSKRQ